MLNERAFLGALLKSVTFASENILDTTEKTSHFESSIVSGNRVPNVLIEAVADVLKEEIELRMAQFVAVEVDETTDNTNQAQRLVILWYISNSEVKEFFGGL